MDTTSGQAAGGARRDAGSGYSHWMMSPGALELLLLCGAALLAGVVDAIGGGGGLITLPALLNAGFPAHLALGTNKGQSVFGSGAALLRYARAGMIDGPRARFGFPLGFAGALGGAWLVTQVSAQDLKGLVAALLVVAALALAAQPMLVTRRASTQERAVPGASRSRALVLSSSVALLLGAYDGFFGPGTGTFLIAGGVLLLGQPIARASADAKVVNFASNLAAVALFASRGSVLWSVALPMALFQALGALLGAQLAVRGGDRLVRPVVLAIAGALVVKLLLA